jgi:hypothetical protein
MSDSTSVDADLLKWRNELEARLRADDGWLTLAGLHWLHEGENSVGGDLGCDVALPAANVPPRLGVIAFRDGVATLHLATNAPVTVDGEPLPVQSSALLHPDSAEGGPSVVTVGTVSFFVIKREAQYGIRVRDLNAPARQTFTGRRWYAIDPAYRLTAQFTAHPTPRQITIINSVGISVPMNNPGWIDFTLNRQALRLEAFDTDKGSLWFIFKDATNGETTYGAGRFLVAALHEDGTVALDFNRAYSPPCAFTPYATCPLPPRENMLTVRVEAGEQYYG